MSHRNGGLIMGVSNKTLTHPSGTPRPVASDSDVVVLALVTAQALESQGEIREAARWLRRGADQARREGDEERVLVLARAAAHMMITTRPASSLSLPRPAARTSSPRLGAARTSWRRATTRRLAPSAMRSARGPDPRQSSIESTIEAMLALMGAAG
jgi:hypothetical protein